MNKENKEISSNSKNLESASQDKNFKPNTATKKGGSRFKNFLNKKLGSEYKKDSEIRAKYERPVFYKEYDAMQDQTQIDTLNKTTFNIQGSNSTIIPGFNNLNISSIETGILSSYKSKDYIPTKFKINNKEDKKDLNIEGNSNPNSNNGDYNKLLTQNNNEIGDKNEKEDKLGDSWNIIKDLDRKNKNIINENEDKSPNSSMLLQNNKKSENYSNNNKNNDKNNENNSKTGNMTTQLSQDNLNISKVIKNNEDDDHQDVSILNHFISPNNLSKFPTQNNFNSTIGKDFNSTHKMDKNNSINDIFGGKKAEDSFLNSDGFKKKDNSEFDFKRTASDNDFLLNSGNNFFDTGKKDSNNNKNFNFAGTTSDGFLSNREKSNEVIINDNTKTQNEDTEEGNNKVNKEENNDSLQEQLSNNDKFNNNDSVEGINGNLKLILGSNPAIKEEHEEENSKNNSKADKVYTGNLSHLNQESSVDKDYKDQQVNLSLSQDSIINPIHEEDNELENHSKEVVPKEEELSKDNNVYDNIDNIIYENNKDDDDEDNMLNENFISKQSRSPSLSIKNKDKDDEVNMGTISKDKEVTRRNSNNKKLNDNDKNSNKDQNDNSIDAQECLLNESNNNKLKIKDSISNNKHIDNKVKSNNNEEELSHNDMQADIKIYPNNNKLSFNNTTFNNKENNKEDKEEIKNNVTNDTGNHGTKIKLQLLKQRINNINPDLIGSNVNNNDYNSCSDNADNNNNNNNINNFNEQNSLDKLTHYSNNINNFNLSNNSIDLNNLSSLNNKNPKTKGLYTRLVKDLNELNNNNSSNVNYKSKSNKQLENLNNIATNLEDFMNNNNNMNMNNETQSYIPNELNNTLNRENYKYNNEFVKKNLNVKKDNSNKFVINKVNKDPVTFQTNKDNLADIFDKINDLNNLDASMLSQITINNKYKEVEKEKEKEKQRQRDELKLDFSGLNFDEEEKLNLLKLNFPTDNDFYNTNNPNIAKINNRNQNNSNNNQNNINNLNNLNNNSNNTINLFQHSSLFGTNDINSLKNKFLLLNSESKSNVLNSNIRNSEAMNKMFKLRQMKEIAREEKSTLINKNNPVDLKKETINDYNEDVSDQLKKIISLKKKDKFKNSIADEDGKTNIRNHLPLKALVYSNYVSNSNNQERTFLKENSISKELDNKDNINNSSFYNNYFNNTNLNNSNVKGNNININSNYGSGNTSFNNKLNINNLSNSKKDTINQSNTNINNKNSINTKTKNSNNVYSKFDLDTNKFNTNKFGWNFIPEYISDQNVVDQIETRKKEENFAQPANNFNVDIYVSKTIKESDNRNKDVAEEAFTNYIYDNSTILHFTNHKVEFSEKEVHRLDNINKLTQAHAVVKQEKLKTVEKLDKQINSNYRFTSGELLYNSIFENSTKKSNNNNTLSPLKDKKSYGKFDMNIFSSKFSTSNNVNTNYNTNKETNFINNNNNNIINTNTNNLVSNNKQVRFEPSSLLKHIDGKIKLSDTSNKNNNTTNNVYNKENTNLDSNFNNNIIDNKSNLNIKNAFNNITIINNNNYNNYNNTNSSNNQNNFNLFNTKTKTSSNSLFKTAEKCSTNNENLENATKQFDLSTSLEQNFNNFKNKGNPATNSFSNSNSKVYNSKALGTIAKGSASKEERIDGLKMFLNSKMV